ncbi:MAG: alpha/beta fold hydrolase [Ruminococcus sp.]
MKYIEYGNENLRTIILLHGGGLSWWNYREEAEILKNEFHVILPILDGHADCDKHFTSIESNANDIISFINEYLNGSVFMIGGLSLGGQVLLEILSKQRDICQHAFIESAMVIPSKITNAMIRPVFGCSYPLIKQKWFAKMQFRQLKIKEELFNDYYRDTCSITKEDMIAFLKANTSYRMNETLKKCSVDVHIYFGERENSGIKESAKALHKVLPMSSLIELPNMYHGDFSVNHSEMYSDAIKALCHADKF